MGLSNLFGWGKKNDAPASACGSACGAAAPEEKAVACGAADKAVACGTACGAGDKQ